METYFERVVETLTAAGYRWYETANFCLGPNRSRGRDLRARHNLGYRLEGTTSASASARSRQSKASAAGTHLGSPPYVKSLQAGSPPPRSWSSWMETSVRGRG